ncbi:hypothetical protein COZ82_03155 [Candidatus Kaiserbacteria bacterium CG_4_8_14_3_um_filter_38_9]|uniref:Uncharacterized protein n=1 Tax=Candidatus Kaiserbacteria bacterium CG_4_8_14_3_um_filter_38_9 TaxID=1974599 RepID=A0A2M7IN59_9BACT|nr:hypothetical protein [Candidatus Kaiserbacteria bacterium]PIW96773.1 MAG: hypothetical protein COZ82_03155 [Candidatus Kaiserbacteria bacterium CG_4_8_14_3_um_filter_38_9]
MIARTLTFSQTLRSGRVKVRNKQIMFRAIGFLIILWGLSHYFSLSFEALDNAATQGFRTFEAAALLSQERMNNLQ